MRPPVGCRRRFSVGAGRARRERRMRPLKRSPSPPFATATARRPRAVRLLGQQRAKVDQVVAAQRRSRRHGHLLRLLLSRCRGAFVVVASPTPSCTCMGIVLLAAVFLYFCFF